MCNVYQCTTHLTSLKTTDTRCLKVDHLSLLTTTITTTAECIEDARSREVQAP